MKKFIKAAAVFMLPVLLIIGVFFAALWRKIGRASCRERV